MTLLFFFSSRRRHTRCGRDWSSDVCSSDLHGPSPDAGSVTLTSSGTPSKLGTRVATEPSQNRVPSRGTQVSFPNGFAGAAAAGPAAAPMRSEERRVGKGGRAGWWGEHVKKK